MITSAQNPKIKWLRDLQSDSSSRRAAGLFVIEGVRLVEEALLAGWMPRWVLYSEGLNERGLQALQKFRDLGAPMDQALPRILEAASDTRTPQGIIAVLEIPDKPLSPEADFLFVADGIRDPGNLGMMLRSAAAAGVQAVLIASGSVDPYSPKVIRAAMGAHFHLPLCQVGWDEIASTIRKNKLKVYLAEAFGGKSYNHADFIHPLSLIVSSEAEGSSSSARALANEIVSIPMPGNAESLNAAAAASILFFEVVRQRSNQT